jgi:Tetratricopeptide repeat
VIARRELMADAGDGDLQIAKEWHAHVLFDLGRFEEAEREWRGPSEERERLFGAGHPDTADALEHHAVTLARLDRVGEAEAEMADAVAKRH